MVVCSYNTISHFRPRMRALYRAFQVPAGIIWRILRDVVAIRVSPLGILALISLRRPSLRRDRGLFPEITAEAFHSLIPISIEALTVK